MEINSEVFDILKEFKIDKSQGTLALLGIYYGLDIDTTCSEEVVKAINLTKVVEKDYKSGTLKWNIPLFSGQQTDWDWVKKWNDLWNVSPARKGANADVLRRMQEFFKKNPKYRVEDVQKATENYLRSLSSVQYIMNSAKFIYDGAGAMKKSTLLSFCEKLNISTANTQQRGKVL
jgi:hypothetical protein